uniref:Uncharacterized protein n=1 Tax=Clytia hemisphaerica TaxID=252671 RepID=A0A7M5XFF4_9CNID
MASFQKDGVLYDPLLSISRSVDKAVNKNKDIARTNNHTVAELEKKKLRSLREITRMQESLVSCGISGSNKKRLTKYASFDESYKRNEQKPPFQRKTSSTNDGKQIEQISSINDRKRSNTFHETRRKSSKTKNPILKSTPLQG